MTLKMTKETKENLIKEFGGELKNTGATEVQIAIFTERIKYLTEHIQEHKKDHHTRRGLISLVNKRRRLLDYLKSQAQEKYVELIKRLDIRK